MTEATGLVWVNCSHCGSRTKGAEADKVNKTRNGTVRAALLCTICGDVLDDWLNGPAPETIGRYP